MKIWKRRAPRGDSLAVQTAPRCLEQSWRAATRYPPLSAGELELYRSLREAVPVIDAAICKTAKLVGGFRVLCPNWKDEEELNDFLLHVQVDACGMGMESFLTGYMEQMLTYGTAVGEIVPAGGRIAALYHAPLEDIELRAEGGPLHLQVCLRGPDGSSEPVPRPELVMVSALNPRPGSLYGESILKGLPFVSKILLSIYRTIGVNWDRVGNVRFAVTCKPGNDPAERAYAKERAQTIAREWGKAMQGDRVTDFVAVGDVEVKVIGADNQILDSSVPVRQMMEQIVAKLGLPPFLLGLSWSTTERMSSQQADLLTSELNSYRRMLHPVICRVCSLWLRLNGRPADFQVEWNKINLQDEVELANARLLNARAAEIEQRLNTNCNTSE